MNMSRRNFLKSFGAIAIGAGATATGGNGNSPSIEQVHNPIKNLKPALEGLRVVQLSDFHLHPYTQIDFVRQAVEMANALHPDLIVLTGDYVTRKAESIFELAPVLATLNAKYGIFTVLGNHDLWTDVGLIRTAFKEAELPILHNEGISLGIGSETLYLAGVDDGWSGQPDLQAALAKRPANAPTILLAHEPDLADTFALDGRVSLQLSGHTHGGQVRLPGIGAPILPELGKKYDQGLFNVNDMWLYTNRGIGMTVPVRINCPPEITEFTLVGV